MMITSPFDSMKLTEQVINQRSKIHELRSIQFLDLSNCRLTEIDFIEFLPGLEVLCLSSNRIEGLKAFERFQNPLYTKEPSKLRELYLRNNLIEEAYHVRYLQHLSTSLRVLFLMGNACTNSSLYRITVKRYLPYLKVLDDEVYLEKREVLRADEKEHQIAGGIAPSRKPLVDKRIELLKAEAAMQNKVRTDPNERMPEGNQYR
jgi:hypothetical protein